MQPPGRSYRPVVMKCTFHRCGDSRRGLSASRSLVAGAVLTLIAVAGCAAGRPDVASQTTAPTLSASKQSTYPVTTSPSRQGTGAGLSSTASASSDPAPMVSVPVPPGEQAVDALGIEIFVPAGLTLDPVCADHSVSRPAYGLTYAISCIPLGAPAVWIYTAKNIVDGASPPRSTAHCLSRPILNGEAGCIVKDPTQNTDTIDLAAMWPHHDVGIQIHVAADQSAWAMRVFNSAHWVSVDRDGCPATRSPVGLAQAPTTAGTQILPEDTASLSICWYSHNRLAASATVDSANAIQALAHPTGVSDGPGIGLVAPYNPQVSAPLCTDLDRTEGIVFLAHTPGRADAVSTAQLADCRGGQHWTNGTVSVLTGEPLASALRPPTKFNLVYGYRVQ